MCSSIGGVGVAFKVCEETLFWEGGVRAEQSDLLFCEHVNVRYHLGAYCVAASASGTESGSAFLVRIPAPGRFLLRLFAEQVTVSDMQVLQLNENEGFILLLLKRMYDLSRCRDRLYPGCWVLPIEILVLHAQISKRCARASSCITRYRALMCVRS